MSNRIVLEDGTELTAEGFGQLLVEQLSDRLGTSLNSLLASERERIAEKAAVELRVNSPLMNDLNETIALKFSELYESCESPEQKSIAGNAILERITANVIRALVTGYPTNDTEQYRNCFRAALLDILTDSTYDKFPWNKGARSVLLDELADRITSGRNAETTARTIAGMVVRQHDFISKIAVELSNDDFADKVVKQIDQALQRIVAEQVNKVLDTYQTVAFKMDNLNEVYTRACVNAHRADSSVRELHQIVQRLEERIELLQGELKLREVPKMPSLQGINPFTGEELQLAAEPKATEEVPF